MLRTIIASVSLPQHHTQSHTNINLLKNDMRLGPEFVCNMYAVERQDLVLKR